MAADDKKASPKPAPKKEAAPGDKSAAVATPAADATPAKAEGGEKPGAAPSSYSRGEGQKPVSQAYKDNWNAIFGNKKKAKPRARKKGTKKPAAKKSRARKR